MMRDRVESSNLASVGYDEGSCTLEVEFINGSVYQYFNVPKSTYEELMQAGSHGIYFSDNIRNVYPYSRI